MALTSDEVKERHKALHRSFDELFACFIEQHPERITYLSATLDEFMKWSHEMTKNPTCHADHKGP